MIVNINLHDSKYKSAENYLKVGNDSYCWIFDNDME